MNAPFQVMPPLTPIEEAELRASIEAHGIQVPVLVDENGDIIDGHNRVKLAAELGVECPRQVREGLTEEKKRTLARSLNTARRMLTREQIRGLIADQLKDTPEQSDRQIAKDFKVSDKTVGSVRRDLESSAEISAVQKRVGADGKTRKQPATKPRPPMTTPKKTAKPKSAAPLTKKFKTLEGGDSVFPLASAPEALTRATGRADGMGGAALASLPAQLRMLRAATLALMRCRSRHFHCGVCL